MGVGIGQAGAAPPHRRSRPARIALLADDALPAFLSAELLISPRGAV